MPRSRFCSTRVAPSIPIAFAERNNLMPSPRYTVAPYENEHICNLRRAWVWKLVVAGFDRAVACASARWPASTFYEALAEAERIRDSFARADKILGPLPRLKANLGGPPCDAESVFDTGREGHSFEVFPAPSVLGVATARADVAVEVAVKKSWCTRSKAWAPQLQASSPSHGMRCTGFPAFLLQTLPRTTDLHAGGSRGGQPVRLEPQRGP